MNEHLLDPNILANVTNFPLLARTMVEGFISGLHRSMYHGFGSEFVQYRHYSKGDDLKYIDWKVYARQDKFQVKVFQEETNANCYIVVDCSASMAYAGEGRMSKLHYAKIVAACLAYLANRQGDNVGLSAYSDDLLCYMKPGHRSGQIQQICLELARLEAAGSCDYQRVFNHLGERFSRRGIIIIISDVLDSGESLRRSLRRFRFAHHDCLVLQILDADELDFPFTRTVRFVDSENDAEIITAPEVVREPYLKAFQEYLDEVQAFCLESNIDHQRVNTSEAIATVLAAYLHRREAIG